MNAFPYEVSIYRIRGTKFYKVSLSYEYDDGGHGRDTFTFYFARQRGQINHGTDASKNEFKSSVLESEQTSTESNTSNNPCTRSNDAHTDKAKVNPRGIKKRDREDSSIVARIASAVEKSLIGTVPEHVDPSLEELMNINIATERSKSDF
jgi:hypothetical protein